MKIGENIKKFNTRSIFIYAQPLVKYPAFENN